MGTSPALWVFLVALRTKSLLPKRDCGTHRGARHQKDPTPLRWSRSPGNPLTCAGLGPGRVVLNRLNYPHINWLGYRSIHSK